MATNNTENNFKKLQEEEERQCPQPPPEIERNVIGTARSIGFVGNVVELYLSKVVDVLSAIFGSNKGRRDFEDGESNADSDDTPKGNTK